MQLQGIFQLRKCTGNRFNLVCNFFLALLILIRWHASIQNEFPFQLPLFAFFAAFAAQCLVLLLLRFLSSLLLALVKTSDVVFEVFLVEIDAQSFVLQSPLLQVRAFALHCLLHPVINQNLECAQILPYDAVKIWLKYNLFFLYFCLCL
ncbi:hypothetical protein V8G54_001874, partial [Vigna mungo]